MKVVLINAPAERNLEKWDAPEHPNIGLAYIAGFLRKKNIECRVIDSKFEKIDIDEIIRKLKNERFDIVGLTSMTHDVGQAANTAREIKKFFPNINIILGGVHVTALPGETLDRFPEFDLAIIGEGEYTFFEIINALREKKHLDKIKGVVFRKNGKIKITPQREKIEDLDKLPFPAWDLFPKADYYNIMTARGCPFNCVFCMSPYGRKVRERGVENVIKEIEWVIKTFSPKIYKFNDETFGFNMERANKILDLIIEKGLDKTKKMASMRANIINLDILKKMKRAGFDYIDLGIESGNPGILKIIKKGITREDALNAVRMIKSVGIKVGVNVILGHPYETKETAKQTIDFAVKLNGDITAIGIMVPYPGTEVAEMAKRGEGGYKILSNDWSDYNKQIGNALELETLSRKELEKMQALGYIKIYLYNLRFLDLFKFFWDYRRAGMLFIKKQFNQSI